MSRIKNPTSTRTIAAPTAPAVPVVLGAGAIGLGAAGSPEVAPGQGPSTTTVKVATATRNRLREYGARTSLTADEVIRAGLAALAREELRRTARSQALELADDEADRAEVQAVREDLDEARAR